MTIGEPLGVALPLAHHWRRRRAYVTSETTTGPRKRGAGAQDNCLRAGSASTSGANRRARSFSPAAKIDPLSLLRRWSSSLFCAVGGVSPLALALCLSSSDFNVFLLQLGLSQRRERVCLAGVKLVWGKTRAARGEHQGSQTTFSIVLLLLRFANSTGAAREKTAPR